MSRIIKFYDDCKPDDESDVVKLAANFLDKGLAIAVPTDTIYGVAVKAQHSKAVDALYRMKNRDKRKPVALCVAKIHDIPRWAKVTIPNSLLAALLPGPVTLVFERTIELNPYLNAGVNLVGIRIPRHNLLLRIVEAIGEPLALTSANISNDKSSLDIKEFESLWSDLSLVIDQGKLGNSEEARFGSTVVDLSIPGFYRTIRDGSALEQTKKKLNEFNLSELFDGIS
uniref:Threonylcarbamoyl-AMP synthase n=1 Tax=Strigamia maritima TaxID=126957 RepID=T1J4N4_STRMM